MGNGANITEVRIDPAERMDAAVRRVVQAIAGARAGRATGVLVVVPQDWCVRPSAAERVAMVRAWAGASEGRVRVAVVASPALFDEQRLGVVAARGFGLPGDAFEHEADARHWLEQPA